MRDGLLHEIFYLKDKLEDASSELLNVLLDKVNIICNQFGISCPWTIYFPNATDDEPSGTPDLNDKNIKYIFELRPGSSKVKFKVMVGKCDLFSEMPIKCFKMTEEQFKKYISKAKVFNE